MNRAEFEQLYITLYPGLYRLAQSILRQEADAQDAVQQAAVKAWAALDRLPPGRERAYFARIVINECRNIQRRRMRETRQRAHGGPAHGDGAAPPGMEAAVHRAPSVQWRPLA